MSIHTKGNEKRSEGTGPAGSASRVGQKGEALINAAPILFFPRNPLADLYFDSIVNHGLNGKKELQ
jgi:hypothetical protein